MGFYEHVYLSDRVIRIMDLFHTAAYLILGKYKACLIDTCNGLGNLKDYIESITNLPVVVVLTHGHFDHAGGACLFDEAYLHPFDEAVYHDYYHGILKKQLLSQFPYQVTLNPERTIPFLPLRDQQIFDLGNISVEMIEVKGHTQGMMMALIREERMIVFGDACGESVLIFDDYSTSISEYRKSLLRIKNDYEDQYDIVLRNHGTFESDKSILDECISCCEDILYQRDEHYPVKAGGYIECFAARAVDCQNKRIDGKHGNVVYRSDKAV